MKNSFPIIFILALLLSYTEIKSNPLNLDTHYKKMFDQAVGMEHEEVLEKYPELVNGDCQKNRWIDIFSGI